MNQVLLMYYSSILFSRIKYYQCIIQVFFFHDHESIIINVLFKYSFFMNQVLLMYYSIIILFTEPSKFYLEFCVLSE